MSLGDSPIRPKSIRGNAESRPMAFMKTEVAYLSILFFLETSAVASESDTKPLPKAHAHNDYEHERPLLDALDLGFTSIEADVFLVDGQLLVAHNFLDVSKDRTLEGLYLKPLQARATANNGRIYNDDVPLTLLVDIKTNGKQAYVALEELLGHYDDLVSVTRDGMYTKKAVTVIVSGDRAKDEIQASKIRRVGIDGRLSDLESDLPADLLPLISDKWSSHFRYRGEGPMPQEERERLRSLVRQAHAKGRRVRFWATPEKRSVWNELDSAGVDLIGTDDLKRLSSFLQARPVNTEK